MLDVTNGISYIHKRKEIHRDLKPHNSVVQELDFVVGRYVFLLRIFRCLYYYFLYTHHHNRPSTLCHFECLYLVLYSRQQKAWKIGDFGLTYDCTSKHACETIYCRGIAGYRAPELIKEAEEYYYTNKVDI